MTRGAVATFYSRAEVRNQWKDIQSGRFVIESTSMMAGLNLNRSRKDTISSLDLIFLNVND